MLSSRWPSISRARPVSEQQIRKYCIFWQKSAAKALQQTVSFSSIRIAAEGWSGSWVLAEAPMIQQLDNHCPVNRMAQHRVGFPSGQRDQTVNLTRKLRWFESSPHHQICIIVLSRLRAGLMLGCWILVIVFRLLRSYCTNSILFVRV